MKRYFTSTRRILPALAFAITLASGTLAAAAPAVAAGTTHYVDNASGSGCSDAGPGTSITAPWCTFTPANALTIGPRDSLLLKRGDSWSTQLSPSMSGTTAGDATIGAYGTGAAPRILATSTRTGLALTDPDYAQVTGLDIGATTS